MKYIRRSMEKVFLKLSDEYPAVLITGPRQAGKTTMLKRLMEEEGRERTYVSLDDLNERSLAKTDPAMFFQLHKPPIFIDEVQYAPELFTYIKIHVDRNYNPGDFWLTGSQLLNLWQVYRNLGRKGWFASSAAFVTAGNLSRWEASAIPS